MIYLKLVVPYLRYLPIALFASWILFLTIFDIAGALWNDMSPFGAGSEFELDEVVTDGDCRTIDGIKICGGSDARSK